MSETPGADVGVLGRVGLTDGVCVELVCCDCVCQCMWGISVCLQHEYLWSGLSTWFK